MNVPLFMKMMILLCSGAIISESLRLGGHTKGPHGYGGSLGSEHSSIIIIYYAIMIAGTPRLRIRERKVRKMEKCVW